jgi:hypothetical protein
MAEWLRHKVPDMRISAFIGVMPQRNGAYLQMVADAMRSAGFPE